MVEGKHFKEERLRGRLELAVNRTVAAHLAGRRGLQLVALYI
jgi:hypothetical protein